MPSRRIPEARCGSTSSSRPCGESALRELGGPGRGRLGAGLPVRMQGSPPPALGSRSGGRAARPPPSTRPRPPPGATRSTCSRSSACPGTPASPSRSIPERGSPRARIPVRPPAAADSMPPSSAIGLRWFSQTAVRGFQSDSGKLSLTRAADGSLSGQFKAAAHPVTGKGPLTLTGSFSGLRERPATRGCSTAPPRACGPARLRVGCRLGARWRAPTTAAASASRPRSKASSRPTTTARWSRPCAPASTVSTSGR